MLRVRDQSATTKSKLVIACARLQIHIALFTVDVPAINQVNSRLNLYVNTFLKIMFLFLEFFLVRVVRESL